MTRTIWHQAIPEKWNDTLFSRGGHFLQSSHWGYFQESLGKEIFAAKGQGWQCLAILETSPFGKRIYCPYGPHVTSRRALDLAIQSLKILARQSHAAYVRIEPIGPVNTEDLSICRAWRAPKNTQPRHTWVKNIARTPGDLIAEMSATNRNLYRNAAKKGISVRQSKDPADIDILTTMVHDVAKQTGITPHPDSYYQKMARALLPGAGSLYVAEYKKQPIAAAFMFDSPTTRYYTHAGSLHNFRKLHAGSPLLVQAILDASKDDKMLFDFVGIAPPDEPDHRWQGFTRFKKSFGGETITYPGTWEIPINPINYSFYRLSHVASRVMR
jgi:lipid II:glycine glycyltransferase (peptidoglycan interpeptide bridge formation enzyme)